MQYKHCLLFLFLLSVSASLHAQSTPQTTGALKDAVTFQSPGDGDTYVPAKTTITIRPKTPIIRGRSAQDFSFTVTGSSSRNHPGKITISDDNQTLIFLPAEPFALDEQVQVIFSYPARDNIVTPVSFAFRVTPMSDSEQCYRLSQLREQERNEILEFQQSHSTEDSHPKPMSLPSDTLPPLFPKILIDTLDPANVSPGEIFLAPTGSNCITIVDNTGTPIFVREFIPNGAEDLKMESGNRLSFFKLETILQGNIFQGVHY